MPLRLLSPLLLLLLLLMVVFEPQTGRQKVDYIENTEDNWGKLVDVTNWLEGKNEGKSSRENTIDN